VIYFTTSLTICRGVIARSRGRKAEWEMDITQLGSGRERSTSDSMVELSLSKRSLPSGGEDVESF